MRALLRFLAGEDRWRRLGYDLWSMGKTWSDVESWTRLQDLVAYLPGTSALRREGLVTGVTVSDVLASSSVNLLGAIAAGLGIIKHQPDPIVLSTETAREASVTSADGTETVERFGDASGHPLASLTIDEVDRRLGWGKYAGDRARAEQ